MRLLAVLAILSVPVAAFPAHAQEGVITYDKAAVASCLEGATDMAQHDCIGKASDACMQAPEGSSTVGMNQCLTAEKDDWDRLLNDNYSKLVEISKTADAALGDAAAPKSLPLLQNMQRDWIAYRDSSCLYAASAFTGGSAAGPAAGQCLLELTAEQALRLGAMTQAGQ